MTADALKLRNTLLARIARAHQQKLGEDKVDNTCEHEYKRFKETVRKDNTKFRGDAYFIVLACLKCKDKRRINYVVEL